MAPEKLNYSFVSDAFFSKMEKETISSMNIDELFLYIKNSPFIGFYKIIDRGNVRTVQLLDNNSYLYFSVNFPFVSENNTIIFRNN